MKRVLALIFASVLLLSALSMVSCMRRKPEPVQVENIGGKTPAVLYEEAVISREEVKEEKGYKVVLDVDFKVHVLVADVPIGSKGAYEYSYFGDNSHHVLSESAQSIFENKYVKQVAGSYLSSLNKEMWYVDGVYYYITSDGSRKKVETENCPISKNVLEIAIDSIMANQLENAICYEQGTEKYFEIKVTGEDMYLGVFAEEIYDVYLKDDGMIDKIKVTGNGDGYSCSVLATYTYDIGKIDPPADPDSFVAE